MRVPAAQVPTTKPREGDAARPTISGFDLHDEALVDHGSVDTALSALLALYPQAPIAAVREDGVFTVMPGSFPVAEHVVLDATSALELVLPLDRPAMIAAWDRVRATRASRCPVHLVSDPERTVAFHAFDVKASHGVYLVVFVPSDPGDEGDRGPAGGAHDLSPVVPKVASVRKDERSFLIGVDEATTQILGWSTEEMAGRRSLEFIHPDDHTMAIENWMEMLASPGPGRRVRLRHKRRDGSWVWLEVTNHNLLDDPDHGCVVSGMVDISDEMAVHELLDRLAEAIPVGLFQVDTARKVVYTNERLHQIIETGREIDVEEQFSSVIERDWPLLDRALENVLVSGYPADIEVELRRPRSRAARYCTINLRALSDGASSITGAIGCLADVTDSTRMRDELKRRATFDDLTGSYNRASLMLALDTHVASRPATSLAVVFVDLDHFKQVNDVLGHAAGDEVLTTVAERLRGLVRDGDIVGRLGGDEFLVISPGVAGPEQAMALAERVARVLRDDMPLGDGERRQQASIGVAWSAAGSETVADALVARADGAMYESKREGAGRPKLARAPAQSPSPARLPGTPGA
jgi:diguanylate cyclase (GGDEF)-like protein/PAS domain S-box-containing protein